MRSPFFCYSTVEHTIYASVYRKCAMRVVPLRYIYTNAVLYFCTLALSAASTVANIKTRYDAKTPQFAIFGTRVICVFYSKSIMNNVKQYNNKGPNFQYISWLQREHCKGHTLYAAQWFAIRVAPPGEPYAGLASCSPYKRMGMCGSVYGYLASKSSLVLFGSEGSALTLLLLPRIVMLWHCSSTMTNGSSLVVSYGTG